MLIFINRNIFNALLDTQAELAMEYVEEQVTNEYGEELVADELKEVVTGIFTVISRNEALIKKIGLASYYHGDYSWNDGVRGYWHRTGRIVVCPFDWGMTSEHDENFSYSFQLARTF